METVNQIWDVSYKLVSGGLSLGTLIILAGIFRKIGGWEQWRINIDEKLERIEEGRSRR